MSAQDCIRIIKEAAGRDMSDEEILAVYDKLGSQVRKIKEQQKAEKAVDAALSPEQLTRQAAMSAAQDLVREAQLKKVRAELSAVAQAKALNVMEAHPVSQTRGLMSLMVRDVQDKGTTLSAESREQAVRAMAFSEMVDAMSATNPRFFGFMENLEGVRALYQELFGGNSGSEVARKAAEQWSKVAEGLRQRFNAAGGEVGKLENWAIPQHHSQRRVAAAGEARWIADIFSKLDREKYVNDDGSLMNDRQMTDFLHHAYETISTGGLNTFEPGKIPPGVSSMRARRHAEERQLFFKDGDAFMDYTMNYGDKGFYQTLTSHIASMARDIALLETFGPNPDHMFAYLKDVAKKSGSAESAGLPLTAVYDELSGRTSYMANQTLGRTFQTARNLQVAAKLGGAVISSLSDQATLYLTAAVNRLSVFDVFKNQLRAMNPFDRTEEHRARSVGLGMETLIGELNRFGEDGLGASWSSKLAAATMRASGLASLTDASKRAFGVTMMSSLGKLNAETAWRDLAAADRAILERKGITESDWDVWKQATREDWNGNQMLTPQAVKSIGGKDATEAATKLLGAVLEETDIAVITAGVREKAILKQGTQAGTVTGELARTLALFKSFPLAMISRHWMRGTNLPTTGGKATYLTSLFVGSTLIGAAAMALKDLANGKDAPDMQDPKQWLRAMTMGGGLGIYGDFVFTDQTRYGGSFIGSLVGPVFGQVEDLYGLTIGNLHQASRGEKTHFGAEALKFAKNNAPLVNLWYLKAAFDHMIFHQLQEYLSPGYLEKMQDKQRKDFGTTYWWKPGEMAPQRPPEITRQ